MKTPVNILILTSALSLPAFSQARLVKVPNQWTNLSRITHKRTYWIETRDRKCVDGLIRGVTADQLTIDTLGSSKATPHPLTFARVEILRVMIGMGGEDIYYSGRSSWTDVRSVRTRGREGLLVETKSAKTYFARHPYDIDDEGITFEASGKSLRISKGEVAKVYDVIEKPLTDAGDYAAGELGPLIVFDPYFYVYSFHLEKYVKVQLYDAEAIQDDSSAQCAARARNLK